ncbi:MAG: hypothetical protein LLG16_03720 [Euryarchaeota archaeon]|nr:hypothetical protein [Euryarchaeota archaeon]
MRPLALTITVIFSTALIGLLIFSLIQGDVYGAATELVCLLLLWVPTILATKDYIQMPWPIVLGIALALFLHSMGLVTDWYNTTFVWDKITHLVSGVILGSLVAIELLFLDRRTESIEIPTIWFVFLITIMILTMEAAWEIVEFTFDHALGTNMQHSLVDTVNDVLTNAISGIVAGLGVVYYLSRSSAEEFLSNLRAEKMIQWFAVRFGRQTRFR